MFWLSLQNDGICTTPRQRRKEELGRSKTEKWNIESKEGAKTTYETASLTSLCQSDGEWSLLETKKEQRTEIENVQVQY